MAAVAAAALVFVAPLTLDLSVAEFVELQRKSDAELRVRFDLPAGCMPRLAAVGRSRSEIVVIIRCDAGTITPSDTRGGGASARTPRR